VIVKFVSMGDDVARSVSLGYGARSIQTAKRVPKPVRVLLDGHRRLGGPVEVMWNTETRQAELVPFYERAGW
jgi:hypothetical protein